MATRSGLHSFLGCANRCCIGLLRLTQLLFLLLIADSAVAQATISPVVVEFGARQRVVSVRISLSDSAPAPMRLQAQVLRWTQNMSGEALVAPTDDLFVTPPIVDLLPGKHQVFRIGLRGNLPAINEMAYRLHLEDIGEPSTLTNGADGMGVRFRMAYDLPVLVAPRGPVERALHWRPCRSGEELGSESARGDEALCVRVHNAGNLRVKVEEVTLQGNGWSQSTTLKDGENILAGSTRQWRLPRKHGSGGAPVGLTVRTSRGETVAAEAADF